MREMGGKRGQVKKLIDYFRIQGVQIFEVRYVDIIEVSRR